MVFSGSLSLGMGNTFDASALHRYGPGDFVYLPPVQSHYGQAHGVTIVPIKVGDRPQPIRACQNEAIYTLRRRARSVAVSRLSVAHRDDHWGIMRTRAHTASMPQFSADLMPDLAGGLIRRRISS